MGYMESAGLISITLRVFYRSCLYKVNVGSTGNWAGGHEAGIIERITVKVIVKQGATRGEAMIVTRGDWGDNQRPVVRTGWTVWTTLTLEKKIAELMLDQRHGRSANNYPALGQMPFQKPLVHCWLQVNPYARMKEWCFRPSLCTCMLVVVVVLNWTRRTS